MSTWNWNNSDEGIRKNHNAARRVFAMLFYTRAFTLDHFIRSLPAQTDVKVAQRRWVLLQAMPPRLEPSSGSDDDIFVSLFRSLRGADTDALLSVINKSLFGLIKQYQDLFPLSEGFDVPYFAIIDEAQGAADHLNEYFRSNNGTDLRPILRELYLFLRSAPWAEGIIFSGTALSTQIVERSVGATSAKNTGRPNDIEIFTDTGRFLRDEPAQRDYVLRYLSLSNDNFSDMRLLERILYWLPGRWVINCSGCV